MYAAGLVELAIGKDYRSHEGPNVQASRDPLRADSDPNRCPTDINEIGALRVAGPSRQKHGRIHASQSKYNMEEKVRVTNRPCFCTPGLHILRLEKRLLVTCAIVWIIINPLK